MTTETTTSTIQTVIHAYNFDTRNADQLAAYKELKAKLKAEGLSCFETWGGGKGHYDFVKPIDGQTVELETSCLFENQWNTAPIKGVSDSGLRVFDWAQDYPINFNQAIKRGHYLEQTDAMREVRSITLKCGYCGHYRKASEGIKFCPDCLDSQYLKEDDLLKGATRLVPVDQGHNWTPLTEAEQAELLPRYRDAQVHGSTERGKARLVKQRADIESEFKEKTANVKVKRDGLIWLLDHGISIDNVIYYDHREMFSFGWLKPVSAAVRDRILEVISEFPFEYEIKAEDKVYSGRE